LIEIKCSKCDTILSLGAEQSGDIIFCPACETELSAPPLDFENKSILQIDIAQKRKSKDFSFDPQKFKKIFSEPVSPETVQWKKALSKSFEHAIPDHSNKLMKTS